MRKSEGKNATECIDKQRKKNKECIKEAGKWSGVMLGNDIN